MPYFLHGVRVCLGEFPVQMQKFSRQRGAMERSMASDPDIFGFRRRQSAELFDESRVLRYARACASFRGRGDIIEGFAHLSSLSSRK